MCGCRRRKSLVRFNFNVLCRFSKACRSCSVDARALFQGIKDKVWEKSSFVSIGRHTMNSLHEVLLASSFRLVSVSCGGVGVHTVVTYHFERGILVNVPDNATTASSKSSSSSSSSAELRELRKRVDASEAERRALLLQLEQLKARMRDQPQAQAVSGTEYGAL